MNDHLDEILRSALSTEGEPRLANPHTMLRRRRALHRRRQALAGGSLALLAVLGIGLGSVLGAQSSPGGSRSALAPDVSRPAHGGVSATCVVAAANQCVGKVITALGPLYATASPPAENAATGAPAVPGAQNGTSVSPQASGTVNGAVSRVFTLIFPAQDIGRWVPPASIQNGSTTLARRLSERKGPGGSLQVAYRGVRAGTATVTVVVDPTCARRCPRTAEQWLGTIDVRVAPSRRR